MPDQKGYPTDEELKKIKNWDVRKSENAHELMGFIREIWWNSDWGFEVNEVGAAHHKKYILHTIGWSGNEDIIWALRCNKYDFWPFYWLLSERGGHYTFVIPINKKLGK